MALIGLLCPNEDMRRSLTLAVEELGHRVAYASQVRDALDLFRGAQKPQLFVVASDTTERVAEVFLGEKGRVSPVTPVVVALAHRDASRAVDLLRSGAYEVVSPPWNRENLSACLAKALRFKGTAMEALQPLEKTRSAIFFFAAAAVFLGVSLSVATLERRRQIREIAAQVPASDWAVPYSHPAGMAFDGKEIWVADWFSQTIYRHDPATLAVRRMSHFPAEMPIAIAFAGDGLWTVSAGGVIKKHMLDDKLTVLTRVPDRFQHTIGIAYDGLYLWTLDNKEHILRKHLLDDELTVLDSYRFPWKKPAALAFDGKHLWSLDAAERELIEHDMDDPRRVVFRTPLHEYQSGQWNPTGLIWDGTHFWSVAESAAPNGGLGRLFRHSVALGK